MEYLMLIQICILLVVYVVCMCGAVYFLDVYDKKTKEKKPKKKVLVFCKDCKQLGVGIGGNECHIPIVITTWFEQNIYNTQSPREKNENNDCLDFEVVKIEVKVRDIV